MDEGDGFYGGEGGVAGWWLGGGDVWWEGGGCEVEFGGGVLEVGGREGG